MALALGTRLGAYEILTLLGAGGMGEVYRARDTKLNRNVALKVLPEAFAYDAERLARFQREAELLAALNHPNIAAIYGIEDADGTRALVLELVDGPTLADRIAKGPIPIDEALPIARQIAEALEAAHEQGVIHRDLKPANIKVREDGTVKVLDFGLAKLLESGNTGASRAGTSLVSQSPTITSPAMMTGIGVILGTAAYMSPEQAKGRQADKRSDVWAFGCVLYDMLTGKRAFEGEDVSDTIAAVLRGQPDWTALPADVPAAVRVLITRCLERDRRQRIGDVAAALFVLREPGFGAIATVPLPSESRWQPLWRRVVPAAIAAALAIAATVAVLGSRPSPAAPVTRFPLALSEGQRFSSRARNLIAISPDGATIAFEAGGQLYVRNMADLEARPLPGTSTNPAAPFFSPDGRWIGYLSRTEQKLKKVAVAGGSPLAIADVNLNAGDTFGPVWAADDYVYVGQLKRISRVSSNGGKLESIVTLKENEAAHRPQLLPGGEALLFTYSSNAGGGSDNWDNSQIVVQSLKTGERTVVIQAGSDARYVPTGHIVYAVGTTVLAAAFDVSKHHVGTAVPILERVSRAAGAAFGGADMQIAIADNGSMAYIPATSVGVPEFTLALADRSGHRSPLNIPPGPYSSPRISPDGKRLAITSGDLNQATILIGDLKDGSPLRKLTFDGRNNTSPLWTRDGERILFTSDRDGEPSLFWQRADGGPAERVAKVADRTRPQAEAWSPDGQILIFTNRTPGGVGNAGNAGISLVSLAGDRKPSLLIKPFATNATLSPDGRWLAYTGQESRAARVYAEPFPPTGEKHQISIEAGDNPLWGPNGKQLYFLSSGTRQIMSVDIQTNRGFVAGKITPLPIHGIAAPGPRPYDITPDGITFLVMVPKGEVERTPPEQINVTLNWFTELQQRVPAK